MEKSVLLFVAEWAQGTRPQPQAPEAHCPSNCSAT